jgi:hypothetical protein
MPNAGKVRIEGSVVGIQPGLRSGGGEHESFAKVLDHLQPSTAIV